jgi:hypothetical protein
MIPALAGVVQRGTAAMEPAGQRGCTGREGHQGQQQDRAAMEPASTRREYPVTVGHQPVLREATMEPAVGRWEQGANAALLPVFQAPQRSPPLKGGSTDGNLYAVWRAIIPQWGCSAAGAPSLTCSGRTTFR